jgi:hypothetical protein
LDAVTQNFEVSLRSALSEPFASFLLPQVLVVAPNVRVPHKVDSPGALQARILNWRRLVLTACGCQVSGTIVGSCLAVGQRRFSILRAPTRPRLHLVQNWRALSYAPWGHRCRLWPPPPCPWLMLLGESLCPSDIRCRSYRAATSPQSHSIVSSLSVTRTRNLTLLIDTTTRMLLCSPSPPPRQRTH